ncbi:unnamed protein product [Closterium sp. NIES-65]|nr:unnamed protein product [Closterium sp. NIES-65]
MEELAMVFTSTNGPWEEWLCVQVGCGKAHGVSFAKAAEHAASVMHCTERLKARSTMRQSKGKMNLLVVKKEFGMENQRMLEAWAGFDLRDDIRALNPGERQYTFKARPLKKELHLVISGEQHGFIPGRSFAYAVSVVADTVEAADNGGEDWYILKVDFQKGYDTVARPYLFETMDKLGIPAEFIRWTEGLHHGFWTRLAINGWVGERVEMQRGVRQGCPLAPYLFLCALEPLCQNIKETNLGLSAERATELSYVGYADDTTLILKREEQLREAEAVLEQFGAMSSMRTNKDKSVVMPLGRNKWKSGAEGVNFKWAADGVPERMLGIWITPNGDAWPSWGKAWEKGKTELVKWESQHLLTAARVIAINAYIMPIFIFQGQVYPPPEELWKHIKKTCDNYVSSREATADKYFVLWSGELARLPNKEGGLGLIDPKARIDSMAVRMQWPGGSQRWKAAVGAFWESPYAELSESKTGWEVEQAKVCFNRKVMFRGKSPYENQQGMEGIREANFGVLVKEGPGGGGGAHNEEQGDCENGAGRGSNSQMGADGICGDVGGMESDGHGKQNSGGGGSSGGGRKDVPP